MAKGRDILGAIYDACVADKGSLIEAFDASQGRSFSLSLGGFDVTIGVEDNTVDYSCVQADWRLAGLTSQEMAEGLEDFLSYAKYADGTGYDLNDGISWDDSPSDADGVCDGYVEREEDGSICVTLRFIPKADRAA